MVVVLNCSVLSTSRITPLRTDTRTPTKRSITESCPYVAGRTVYVPVHDDVTTRKCFLRYWPFVRGIDRSSLHRGSVMRSFGFFFVLGLNTLLKLDLRRHDAQVASLHLNQMIIRSDSNSSPKRGTTINVDFGARSRYPRQGWIITSRNNLQDVINHPSLRHLLLAPYSSNMPGDIYIGWAVLGHQQAQCWMAPPR